MYAIKKIASIHINSTGYYFENHSLGIVESNLQTTLEKINSYLLGYWSTISGTNLPRAGPAAAMVDRKKGILYSIVQKKVHSRQHLQGGTAPSNFKLRGWLMDLCCSQKGDLS